MVKAMLEIPLGGFQRTARAQAELLLDGLQGGAEGTRIGKRTEVSGAILFSEAHQFKARNSIPHLDADHDEAFIVAEADVVLRAPLLDQLSLEENRLGIAFDQVPFIVGSTIDQGSGFQVDPIPAGRGEVVGETPPQITGLPHIDDLCKSVANHINTRPVRHLSEFLVERYSS